ncbi:MAG: LysR family transcriptional regulator [Saccharospirillum sp.]
MQETLPNIRHLRAFSEVAEAHSISLAAERIFLSQSAITQAIKKLEAHFATALFLRRHNGMYLTDAGQLLQRRVHRCMAFLRGGVREAMRIGERKVEGNRVAGQPHTLISLSQIRALFALQHAASYTDAARAIGVSQPALYRSAGELEDLLNTQLFEKTSAGISLTRAALRLVRAFRLGVKEIEQALDELSEFRGADSSQILVGSMPLARTFILPSAINRLARFKPEVRVGVIEGPYDDLLQRLLHGEVDVLIGALRDPAPSTDILQERLFSTELSVVARRGHPLDGQRNLALEDLAPYGWVVPRSGTPARRLFEQLIAKPLPSAQKGLVECSSQVVIRELLLGSDRLTFISSHQIEHEQKEGILTVLDTQLDRPARPIGVTIRKDWQPTTTQRLFISILRDLSQGLRR